MSHQNQIVVLLASDDADLLHGAEAALRAGGMSVEIALSAAQAMERIAAPAPLLPALSLVLLDPRLPGMPSTQFLAAARAEAAAEHFAVVLFSDTALPEWTARMAEGGIDDLVPYGCAPDYLRLRVERARLGREHKRELEQLREAVALAADTDPLTCVLSRSALLAALFRETDRAQRMNTSLSVILFDIDDFGHWNSLLGTENCDWLLMEATRRAARLLRTYDLFGRMGKDEFLCGLPGCSAGNAALLAARIRAEVFSQPFRISGHAVRLSACFGVTASGGRSPVIVLREAEEALRLAREEGPETIRHAGGEAEAAAMPVPFPAPVMGDELLRW